MKITKGTIVRTIMLFAVMLGILLRRCGINVLPIEETEVVKVVETVIELGSILAAWWYNNSFSSAARKADEFFKTLKEGENENV